MKLTKLVISISALVAISTFSLAADNENALTVYEAPKPIDRSPPRYPPAESVNGGEGWVVVNYMVDKEGKVFDPEVVASSGSESFERSALKALETWQYEPAKSGDTLVDAGLTTKLSFALKQPSTGARPAFRSKYMAAFEALGEEDWPTVGTLLTELETTKRTNNYEAAFLDYLRAALAGHNQDTLAEIKHLENALQAEHLHPIQSSHLPPELTTSVRRRLYALQVEHKQYAAALHTYSNIQRQGDVEFTEAVAASVEQIKTLQDDDTVYNLQAATNDRGRWSIALLKRGFSVETDDNQTPLQEVKVHCQKKHIFFEYKSREEYKIPDSWGRCSVIVLGQADSPFTFWQF